MDAYFKSCFFYSILLQYLTVVAFEYIVLGTAKSSKSLCVQAGEQLKNKAIYAPSLHNAYCNKKEIFLASTSVKTCAKTAMGIRTVKPMESTTANENTIYGKIEPSSTTRTASTTVFATTSTVLATKITPTVNSIKSVCSPAEPKPNIQFPCTPLNKTFGAYCAKYGVKLDSHLFKTIVEQEEAYEKLIIFQFAVEKLPLLPIHDSIRISEKCLNVVRTVYCRHYFPTCDQTGPQMKEQKLCKATCDYFKKTCEKEVKVAKLINDIMQTDFSQKSPPLWNIIKKDMRENLLNAVQKWPRTWEIIDCTTFPTREAGTSPECWYYEGKNMPLETNTREEFENGCFHEDGRGYQGDISVTSSGIPCQSWTAQCPHRHTMVSTYPELKNFFNYCRNPRGSGKRPWCFTSDKNKRWEYCDIPSCSLEKDNPES